MIKKHAPATQRNREAILAVLQETLPDEGTVLEVAAGSGEHAVFFAPAFPSLSWQPSDVSQENLASIAAWGDEVSLPNLNAPIALDVTRAPWPVENPDPDMAETKGLAPISAILAINLVHIAPWRAAEGLFAGAGRILPKGGLLYLYGPYKFDGAHSSQSNVEFEQWLLSQDPEFGVRDIADLERLAHLNKLHLERRVAMPANNFSLIFRKD